MTGFIRFPSTPHLAWLGEGRPRNDKVLPPNEALDLLDHDITVEEKVDGANLGFSMDEHGGLRIQNRGSYIDLETPKDQFKRVKSWLAPRRSALEAALYPDLMIFGEWCYAVHSISYKRLPDWFLVFDVLDRGSSEFWSSPRRDAFSRTLDLAVVPRIANGRFDIPALTGLLRDSVLTDGPAEGLYVRRDTENVLRSRAKLVRPEFVQAISEHWSKRAFKANTVLPPLMR